MGEIVNLNKFRKTKARSEKERQADANRVTFGTPKGLKDLAKAKKRIKELRLDGKKLDEHPSDPGRDD